MKLRVLSRNNGFTIFEIIIVFGILAIIFALGLPIAGNFYLDYQFDGEISLIAALLRHTRNLSMVNHNEAAHGLYFDASNFVVFQGASYASRVIAQDRIFSRNTGVTIVGPSELIFSALSGQTSSTTYTLSVGLPGQGGKSWEIFVNPEGLVYE